METADARSEDVTMRLAAVVILSINSGADMVDMVEFGGV